MGSIREDDLRWKLNPWYLEHGEQYSDYTSFYVGIIICMILIIAIVGFNLVICCCSEHKHYWRDPNTGNRLVLPLWIQPPKNQPPLTLLPELSTLTINKDY
jgi:hypothetical protein